RFVLTCRKQGRNSKCWRRKSNFVVVSKDEVEGTLTTDETNA
ncbi:hypothetical protein MPER_15785, partial [Moniliophthora perniciosa FA553]